MPARELPPEIEVAAGIVFRDGRLLIARRGPGSHLAGLWEFPGGKRHPGETFPECLARELREELDIDVAVGELFESITHDYPEKRVRLEFYICQWLRNEPRPIGCAECTWVRPSELPGYDFPAADARILQRLQASV